jgi:hypothetical protein
MNSKTAVPVATVISVLVLSSFISLPFSNATTTNYKVVKTFELPKGYTCVLAPVSIQPACSVIYIQAVNKIFVIAVSRYLQIQNQSYLLILSGTSGKLLDSIRIDMGLTLSWWLGIGLPFEYWIDNPFVYDPINNELFIYQTSSLSNEEQQLPNATDLAVVNTKTNALTANVTLPLDRNCIGANSLAFDSHNDEVYASLGCDVFAVSGTNPRVVSTIRVISNAFGREGDPYSAIYSLVYDSRNHNIYVSAFGFEDLLFGMVSIISDSSNKITGNLTTSNLDLELVLDLSNNLLYGFNLDTGASNVEIYNLTSNAVAATIYTQVMNSYEIDQGKAIGLIYSTLGTTGSPGGQLEQISGTNVTSVPDVTNCAPTEIYYGANAVLSSRDAGLNFVSCGSYIYIANAITGRQVGNVTVAGAPFGYNRSSKVVYVEDGTKIYEIGMS